MRSRFLIFGILVGMVVLVGAAAPDWINGASGVNYTIVEGAVYYHNFSANITGFSGDVDFEIAPTDSQRLYWTNSSGTFNFTTADIISDWISIVDVSTGNLTINATYNNQTGFFKIPIKATNTTGETAATTEDFEFQINATNDAPNFTLEPNYSVSVPNSGNTTKNISLVGSDEEEQYPLEYNVSISGCSLANWSSKGDCSLTSSVVSLSNTTSTLAFSNLTYNDAGDYNLTICVLDNVNGSALPLYYDSNYAENKSYCQNTTLSLLSSLSVDVTNCTGATVVEGEQFNCTINITTQGSTDSLNLSSYAFFSSNPSMSYDSSNRDWFYEESLNVSSGNFLSVPVSVIPAKNEVGNWTINFSVVDLTSSEASVSEIEIYVNFTESVPELDVIPNVTIYEDYNFDLRGYDDDVLIWDSSVKDEVLTFASNTTWVSVTSPAITNHNINYSTSSVVIDFASGLAAGEGNHSVNISVNDSVGNLDWKVFVVEVLNSTTPVWLVNDSVVLNLTEDVLFTYNVSVNVSDPGETLEFYYDNVSEEFCSLNATNFNSSGMISFTPVDCDVGLHNVSIIASNGKLNSSGLSFLFNVSNVADVPSIFSFTGNNGSQSSLVEDFNFVVPEGVVSNFSLILDDEDFLIPSGQRAAYYNESLTINVTFTNSTGAEVDLFNFSFVEFAVPNSDSASYNATFTPGVSDVGNYTVFVNITDASNNSVNRTWFLNVTEVLEAPVLSQINNESLTIHDYLNFSVNATDDEDDFSGSALNYSIVSLDAGSPVLAIGIVNGSVEFDMNSNASTAGEWNYNISVNDSDGMLDWQRFTLFVYGNASLSSPSENSIYNLTENVSAILNFTINHSVGDNLTYEFWIDNISCTFQNSSNCTYGNLSLSVAESSFGNGSVFGWNFTPDFEDETYGNLKNLTVSVYPNSTELNSSQRASVAVNFSFKLNISHTNAAMRAIAPIGLLQSDYNSNINLDLSSYFADEDVSDTYYLQNVTFVKSSGHADISVSHSSGWDVVIGTIVDAVFSGFITINGSDNLTSDLIEGVEVSFTEPTVVSTPSSGGGGGSSSRLKFYSLRIIVPEDVIISDENFIEIPFGLENHASVDLEGINLTSEVLYNNEFSDDVRIDLGSSYIDVLKTGERRDFTMKIFADTDRSGKYKATIFANIASPQFEDWADFFIDLRKTNETEAKEFLVFTEKIIASNPECLELTEVFRRAQETFDGGNEAEAVRLAQEVSEACEDAISANEQVQYRIEGLVERNFYYISFVTLAIFFAGFVVYVYKRVRFNKSAEDSYVREGVR